MVGTILFNIIWLATSNIEQVPILTIKSGNFYRTVLILFLNIICAGEGRDWSAFFLPLGTVFVLTWEWNLFPSGAFFKMSDVFFSFGRVLLNLSFSGGSPFIFPGETEKGK